MQHAASQHTFEIRYNPNAEVLDHRGAWTKALSEHMGLSEWRVDDNRLDVFDKGESNRCFVSFRNSGCVTRDTPTDLQFQVHTLKFFKFVLDFSSFPDPLFVQRIGVRARYLTPFAGTFDSLLTRYKDRYLTLTPAADQAIRGDLVDIGGPLNFTDDYGKFDTNSGPMGSDQSHELFPWRAEDDLPEVGLYYEIDYSRKPRAVVSGSEILQLIKDFSDQGSARHDRVRALVLKRN